MRGLCSLLLLALMGLCVPAQAGPPREVPPKDPTRGFMDKAELRQVISAHTSEVRHCYELQLTKNPQLQGRVLVQFTISLSGGVAAALVQSSTANDPVLEQCIVERVKTWVFPKPQGGIVIVTYPFVLVPGESPADAAAHAPPVSPASSGPQPLVLHQDHRWPKEKIFAPDPHLPEQVKTGRACSRVFGVYELCIQPDGSISSVEPVQSIQGADDALMGTLKTWRFKPLSRRTCFRQQLDFLIDGGCPGGFPALSVPLLTKDEALPQRTGPLDEPTLPDSVRAANLCGKFTAVYRITIGNTGRVWANHRFGSRAGERAIIDTLQTWTFKPRLTPAVFDHSVRFSVLCDGTEERLGPGGEVLSRSAAKHRIVAAEAMRAQKISTNDEPRFPQEAQRLLRAGPLTASYFLCIGRSGEPESIEPIEPLGPANQILRAALAPVDQSLLATLARWRFKPQTEPTCFTQTLRFEATNSP